MYDKVSTDMNFVERREKKTEKFWADNQIFEKSIYSEHGPAEDFYYVPLSAMQDPSATLSNACRLNYSNMYNERIWLEKPDGIPTDFRWSWRWRRSWAWTARSRSSSTAWSPSSRHCKESVWKYKGMWEDFSSTVGFWADMEHPYVTYDNDFIESEWWALKQIWEQGPSLQGL